MPSFRIGRRVFLTKAAAVREVRRILHTSPKSRPLEGPDGELVADLFAMHPDAAMKAGVGVAYFLVRINDLHGARSDGFHVIRTDGTSEAFSYMPCLWPQRYAEPNLLMAMRNAIMPGQRAILLAHLGGLLPVCMACLRPLEGLEAHAHHQHPWSFDAIARAFQDAYGARPVASGHLGDVFADPEDARLWLAFHDQLADRVVVCAECNVRAEVVARRSA